MSASWGEFAGEAGEATIRQDLSDPWWWGAAVAEWIRFHRIRHAVLDVAEGDCMAMSGHFEVMVCRRPCMVARVETGAGKMLFLALAVYAPRGG